MFIETHSPCATQDLKGCRVEQRVLETLLASRCPKLSDTLERVGLEPSYLTAEWFPCLFVTALPPETVARVWDVLMVEGPKVLLRVGLALFKVSMSSLCRSWQWSLAILQCHCRKVHCLVVASVAFAAVSRG